VADGTLRPGSIPSHPGSDRAQMLIYAELAEPTVGQRPAAIESKVGHNRRGPLGYDALCCSDGTSKRPRLIMDEL